jgi:hypothetical protein
MISDYQTGYALRSLKTAFSRGEFPDWTRTGSARALQAELRAPAATRILVREGDCDHACEGIL